MLIHLRSREITITLAVLLAVEWITTIISMALLSEPAYALVGPVPFCFIGGFMFSIFGIACASSIATTLNLPSTYARTEEVPYSGAIALVALVVTLAALAAFADTIEVSLQLRVASWVFLTLFCLAATFIAALAYGRVEDGVDGTNSFLVVRWIFLLSFVFPPLRMHFLDWPMWATVTVLVGQVVFAGYLMFSWEKEVEPSSASARM